MSGECGQDYGLRRYSCSQETNSKCHGCINKQRLSDMSEFATKTNIILLFCLSACYELEGNHNAMNCSNIWNLIEHTNTLNDNASNLFAFEFGNELQLYQISNLKLIGNDDFSSSYTSSFLCDLNTTINNDGNKYRINDVLYRSIYHHYSNCGYLDCNNKAVFDLTCLESIHSSKYIPCIIPWMGEGSSHSGDTSSVFDTMIDNFYYVYQLGNVLTYGVT